MATGQRRRPQWPVYVFVLWSEARGSESRILDDISARFSVLDVAEVVWTPDERFAHNLSRMYGDALPPGSAKEVHCGTGPFLAVVVEDRAPRFGVRRTSKGRKVVNCSVFDARWRYRAWTGGGYRVHASDSVVETERNLVLLFGRSADAFRNPTIPPQLRRVHASDPVGTDGWESVQQLLLVLRAYGARASELSPAGDALHVVTSDAWWADLLAGGRLVEPGVRELQVAGRPLTLTLTEQQIPLQRALAGARQQLRRRTALRT
jgi:hypothetical protein